MRKTALLLLFVLLLTTRTATMADYNDELLDIIHYTESINLPINDWSVTIREQVSAKKATDLIKKMKKEGLKETKKEKASSVNYLLHDIQNSTDVDVYYNVIVHSGKAELIAVIEGQGWSEKTLDTYVEKIVNVKNNLFTDMAQTFACLTTTDDAIISSDYFFKDFTKKFDIQHQSKQFDNNENSAHNFIFYGYTPLWTQEISLDNTPMNIQVAVTENAEGHLTYTIGTPILINEY
ncbi:YwmB family TATA-box binding protein [Oceanobacillus manasiensis]|uniref:YwmB family TATA-box binding protein n=1 Tax=Oceanobacillus manasiensis TaxID=586413 RepID=UPI0005A672B2|nr:YwmB family TATA-box binding protein [Oceanobacillus manasiensis]